MTTPHINNERGLQMSRSTEWFTPGKYLETIRAIMGEIELDPASCPEANLTVKAQRYFTAVDNGLLHPWKCKTLFLNPPYTKGNMAGRFARKLITEYELKNTEEAILLVNARSGYKWFEPLWNYPICFTDHLMRFVPPGGIAAGPAMCGQCFVYFGGNPGKFIKLISEYGHVVVPKVPGQ